MTRDGATQGTLQVDGAGLRFRIDGPRRAPVLVLSNSLGTTLELWDAQVPRLSAFFQVLRYDHRGHGGSTAPRSPYEIADLGGDLLGLLDALDVDQAAVCGISLGGMVAMWLAAHHPARVASIVVACSAPELGPTTSWQDRAAGVRRDGLAPLLPNLLERWLTPEVRERRPDLVAGVARMLERCDAEGYAACCEAIGEMDLRPVLGDIRAPSLVIGGAHDPVTPPATQLALAERLAAGLLVLPASSHLANLSEPDAFTEAVLSHVAGSPARRGATVRRAVLGEEHVARAAEPADSLSREFSDFITRYAWGEVWSRPGLDRRTRSAATLALLVASGRYDELSFHIAAARRNGLSAEEIREVVLHCAIYAGLPVVRGALPVVHEALERTRPADGGAGS